MTREDASGHPAAVSIEAVSVRFPRRADATLADVNIVVPRGERLIVFGTSGAGKSTLLRTITGAVPHSVNSQVHGRVRVLGVDTVESDVAQLSRAVGLVAQDPHSALALPDVEQELALPLENRAVPADEISGRIDDALALVDAGDLRTRPTSTLSGGEAQRVALAAALIGGPQVVLLDEPTSMLDAEGVSAVRRSIASVTARSQCALVLVEHRIDEFAGIEGVGALPERAVVVGADGHVLADGHTADVLHDHGAALHAAGCWLPLDVELAAAVGIRGGLANADVRDALRRLAEAARPEPVIVHAGGTPVLRAEKLDVSRDARRRPRRRKRLRTHPVPVGRAPVLRDIDLELRAGEIVAVVGRNGVGKSSLLLTLAGLLAPAAGAVTGERSGMIFQNPEHQFVANTVRAEIGHGLGTGSMAAAAVDDALQRFGLVQLADQNPYRLSGGEKRRLSIAAMLVHNRPVLLADEPTYGLDRRATIGVRRALEISAAAGRAILFSAHDLRFIAGLAHRTIVLGAGTIMADGPTREILRDEPLLRRAGIYVPPLIEFLSAECGTGMTLRTALHALDDTVAEPADTR